MTHDIAMHGRARAPAIGTTTPGQRRPAVRAFARRLSGLAWLALALGPEVVLAGPSAAVADAPASAMPARGVSVEDDTGQRLTLAVPAGRIVSLAPHLTELLFDAGAGDRVVGVSAYSDHPAAARALPQVGDSAMLDLERIVSLRPALLALWASGTPAGQQARLRSLGVPVFHSEIRQASQIPQTLRRLGELAGTADVAEDAARRFEREWQSLRDTYAGRMPLRVFFQIWHQPLMTVNQAHLIDEALRACGAVNVFASLPALTPVVEPESVLAAAPDAIVVASRDRRGSTELEVWQRLDARRGRQAAALLVVDPDRLSRPTTRFVDGTRDLCTLLDDVRAGRRGGPVR